MSITCYQVQKPGPLPVAGIVTARVTQLLPGSEPRPSEDVPVILTQTYSLSGLALALHLWRDYALNVGCRLGHMNMRCGCGMCKTWGAMCGIEES